MDFGFRRGRAALRTDFAWKRTMTRRGAAWAGGLIIPGLWVSFVG